ncbi:MAG TPA: hypothetical protein VG077_04595 [Verrucomicrobiae bacterium]|nr:hypothetical protein [Verrucomicrobiae bacterium]
MQLLLHLLIFWVLAFATLGMALLLLSVFFALIEDDLTLHNLGKETMIAAVASLIEGASVWVVVTFIPLGARALFIPALIVGLIYKVTHLEDWSRYEIILLLLFQLVISAFGACLVYGHFVAALGILFIFAVCLGITIAFMRGL